MGIANSVADRVEVKMTSAMDGQKKMMKEMGLEMGMRTRQCEISLKMAQGKERFWYYSLFVGSLALILPLAAIKQKDPKFIAGLVPMSLMWAFQYDMFYGNLNIRAQREADRLIQNEPERFFLPKGNMMFTQP